MNSLGETHVHDDALERLGARCQEQAEAAVLEAPASAESPTRESADLRGHEQSESILQELKRIKSGKKSSLCELWDEERRTFTNDGSRMAEIIERGVAERQGTSSAFPLAGQGLLDSWQAEFSRCRL